MNVGDAQQWLVLTDLTSFLLPLHCIVVRLVHCATRLYGLSTVSLPILMFPRGIETYQKGSSCARGFAPRRLDLALHGTIRLRCSFRDAF